MNNLETELRKVEFSTPNDNISYEQHSYNGFTGMQGSESYYIYLDKLYNEYASTLNLNIVNLLTNNKNNLLNYLSDKTSLFNTIKVDFKDKNYMDWDSYLKSRETYDKNTLKSNTNAKNEYNTVKFFKEITDIQLYFINKIIGELQRIYNSYNPNAEPQRVSPDQIEKETWDNTLSNYGDIINTFDLAKIFGRAETTITRWVREGVITPIDKKKRPMQFKKDDIKKYYLKMK